MATKNNICLFGCLLQWMPHREYVGYIDEILDLDYRNHCTTIFVYD